MQIVDANVLLYAVNEQSPEQATARDWLAKALDGGEVVAFPWTVILAFLRLSTHASVFPRPLNATQAADVVELWMNAPAAVLVQPTPRHLSLLRGLLAQVGTAGNLVNDAHLATLALEHGATIVSYDRDFARFSGVTLSRPG